MINKLTAIIILMIFPLALYAECFEVSKMTGVEIKYDLSSAETSLSETGYQITNDGTSASIGSLFDNCVPISSAVIYCNSEVVHREELYYIDKENSKVILTRINTYAGTEGAMVAIGDILGTCD